VTVKIYHNPRCSKSRQTLELLQENGIDPEIIRYMDDPPDEATLRELIKMLGITPRELMRRHEKVYKDAGLEDPTFTDDELIEAMAQCPSLIERPIVIKDGKAVLGRPPETVLELL
jgi:arsenate reductase